MTGKTKCKILKDIRRQIAEKNDIDLVIKECTFQGECKGTCPRCEAEVRYLEKELEKRKKLGQTVAVAGIVTLLAVNATGCNESLEDISELKGFTSSVSPMSKTEIMLDGELPAPETTLNVTAGDPLPTAGVPEYSYSISLAEILTSSDNGVEYLSRFTREQIVTYWKNYQVSTSVTEETFRLESNGKECYVTIVFDNNDKIIQVSIAELEQSPSESETGMLVLQGDVAYPEEN